MRIPDTLSFKEGKSQAEPAKINYASNEPLKVGKLASYVR